MTRVILGPPGTGKTTRLMTILEKDLLPNYSSKEIAFCSFTREGANQGVTRAMEKFVLKRDDFPYFRTLHSLAFQELNMTKDKMMDKDHYRQLSKLMAMDFSGYYTEDFTQSEDDKYLFYTDLHRNNPNALKKYIGEFDTRKFDYVRDGYAEYKRMYRVYDYTDLIEAFILRGENVNVKVAIGDETQDQTTLQWQMFWVAFGSCEEVYIAGDDDQAVFQWSGADVNAFLHVPGKQEILDHSYRLPDNILEFATGVTKRISQRVLKVYNGTGKLGTLAVVGALKEVPQIDNNQSWLLLSRNNSHLAKFEKLLQLNGVPYLMKGEPSIKEQDLKLIETLTNWIESGTIDDDTLAKISVSIKSTNGPPSNWFDVVRWNNEKNLYLINYIHKHGYIMPEKFNVRINTIHTAKGAEADNVVVLLDISRNVKKNLEVDPDAEHRVFYVAFTRAKQSLYVVRSESKYCYPLPGEAL